MSDNELKWRLKEFPFRLGEGRQILVDQGNSDNEEDEEDGEAEAKDEDIHECCFGGALSSPLVEFVAKARFASGADCFRVD